MSSAQPGLRTGATPLAVRMRPKSLAEVAGQRHLLTPGSPLVSLANDKTGEQGSVSVILWGPPGTGKTTLAQTIAHSSGRRFVELSAVSAGVRDVRQVMEEARTSRDLYGLSTVLFLDEIHRFSKAQQDALLPGVENGIIILVAATTENPSFSVISPLLSRSLLLTLETLSDDDLGIVVDRAVTDLRGLADRFVLDPEARGAIIRLASGDARRALTALEAASVSAATTEVADGERNDLRRDDRLLVGRRLGGRRGHRRRLQGGERPAGVTGGEPDDRPARFRIEHEPVGQSPGIGDGSVDDGAEVVVAEGL